MQERDHIQLLDWKLSHNNQFKGNKATYSQCIWRAKHMYPKYNNWTHTTQLEHMQPLGPL